MKKKILLSFAAVAVAVTTLPLFAAFEAHVINVTARIENALKVDPQFLNFGTVFPQEKLEKPVTIELSQSFKDEGRVDDVSYFIRQKPKCAITWANGTMFDETLAADGKTHLYTGTGHIKFDAVDKPFIDCGPSPRPLNTDPAVGHGVETWGVLPNLCPYLSKHSEVLTRDQAGNPLTYEDGALPSFHEPWSFFGHQIVWNDVRGHLAKAQNDLKDTWMIDLAVPCFGGYCAQDWESFVHGINASANPAEYTQPIANEHKVFGCDLWVEVSGISLPGLGCEGKLDIVLVMDNSGSISPTEYTTMKNAAIAFVNALLLAPDGPHGAKVSFADGATLDQQLTDDVALLTAAINLPQTGGSTNLSAGIDVAQAELSSTRDRADAPNLMIILTDGAPDSQANAIASANAAKAAGSEIYAVGIGTNTATSAFLHDQIVSDVENDHYFDAANFSNLEAILTGLVQCDND